MTPLRPVALEPTRVYRFYRGGALIDRLRGVEEVDGAFPEDWVGSVTAANNPGRDEPEAGLSRLADGRLLRDAITADPEGWLGRSHLESFGASTGVLVKLLDAAERLPVHAHPDRGFARAHLGSQFGKTEAWIVLSTRGERADLWVGLREDVPAADYRAWIDRQDAEALLSSLNRLQVTAGDVVFLPAGVPHAIGDGVLIAELQESSDFSIVCEWIGFPISPADAHLGLGWDVALEALDLRAHEPSLALPEEARSFFWADEEQEAPRRFAVLIVLEGGGTVAGTPARAGSTFAVPASADTLAIEGELRVLRCCAPEPAPA